MNAEIARLLERDLNTLPYIVTEVATGRVIPVCFEPLVEADKRELDGPVWSGQTSPIPAVFAPVWPAYIDDKQTFKLVCIRRRDKKRQGENQQIQGIVRIGSVEREGGFLKLSLLETAPFNRWEYQERRFSGVGRVLVARLVMESYRQGGRGKVLVSATRYAVNFYPAVGFKSVASPLNFVLDEAGAETLIARVFVNRLT